MMRATSTTVSLGRRGAWWLAGGWGGRRRRCVSSSPSPVMFDKLLVANRGEIACRVMRTARSLGVRTVAVYSDQDAGAMHVAAADEAYRVGEPPAARSYLRGEEILRVARECGAQAIHPGYGFLSENSRFAEACVGQGVVFVGPPPSAIRAMGSKSISKSMMEEAGVPVTPGYHGEDQDTAYLAKCASNIGYPLLIKAVMGGGGKGMRIVSKASEFTSALAACKRESQSSFGDDRVLLEKLIHRPRHVEVQVFADTHGNCVYLFERDCSLQRRHQKVLEEAPAPGLSDELRIKLGEAAVAAAKAVGYVGAGTVEFLFDSESPTGDFYFCEVNTRLQVEHPVTELITNLDLVEWQLRVAAGETLPLSQQEIGMNGHAIEARIYAENPSKGFLPAAGELRRLTFAGGPGIRVDTGVRQGDVVSVHYDPMIAKVVAWGKNRDQARLRLARALRACEVAGVPTNMELCIACLEHPAFTRGGITTAFLEEHEGDVLKKSADQGSEGASSDQKALALASLLLWERGETAHSVHPPHPWSSAAGPWRCGLERKIRVSLAEEDDFTANAHSELQEVVCHADGSYEVQGVRVWAALHRADIDSGGRLVAKTSAGRVHNVNVEIYRKTTDQGVVQNTITLWGGSDGARTWRRFTNIESTSRPGPVKSTRGGNLLSPMPGKIIQVLVEAGDLVEQDQPLVVMEAMKMEMVLPSPQKGTVKDIHFPVGSIVAEGTELVGLVSEGEN